MPERLAALGRLRAGAVARAAVRAPFTRRAWAELAYCLAGFPLAVAGCVLVAVLLALGGGLVLSLVGAFLGLLLLAAALGVARGLGAVQRGLAAVLLGERVPPPRPVRPGGSPLGRLDARLRDAAGWRATGYLLAKLPLALLGLYAVLWWSAALLDVVLPLRWALLGEHPTRRHPHPLGVLTAFPAGGPGVSTFGGALVVCALGIVSLLAAPWVTRAVVLADRRLVRGLLGPGALAERVRELEEKRALAVDDSAALLRRLERDLHDGAQVRLVALAMSLDMARERLGPEETAADPRAAEARALLDTAHRNAVEALAELRDLARGLHPPVLDRGLPDALATLAARSSIPVLLAVDLPQRPTPAIETIAYFCAAELLANAIKHSGAREVAIEARGEPEGLLLRVADDGRGGAAAGAGGGLAGLRQRVGTVDGRLEVASPAGGPTEIAVHLPMRA